MNTSLLDNLQQSWVNAWVSNSYSGIFHVEMRSGKTRAAIHCLNKFKNPRVLISYPLNPILDSWKTEFENLNYTNPNVTFTNFSSLHKYIDNQYDIFIIDEIQDLSQLEFEYAAQIKDNSKYHLGLSGTISSDTLSDINFYLGIPIIVRYSKNQAIKDDVVSDYNITIHTVNLDNKVKTRQKNGKYLTEKKKYDNYTYVIEKLKREGKDFGFLTISRARVIANSISKKDYTKKLLEKYKNDRVLVVCGLTKIIDDLNIPAYHSKQKNDDFFEGFKKGQEKHMGIVKLGKVGTTYHNLDRIIINYFTGNSEELSQVISRAMLNDSKQKVAKIDIITTSEPEELNRLKKAIVDFNKTQIKWIT